MKKVLTLFLTVFACATTLFTFSAFTVDKAVTASHPLTYGERSTIHIVFNYLDGTFTCHGAVNASGTWTMDVKFAGKTFHCINTLTTDAGDVLVAISHCNNVTMNGRWNVTKGTGVFANKKGNGSLVMTDTTEEWEGSLR